MAGKVRLMQRNWIGRSEGLLIRFKLDAATSPGGEDELPITRPDRTPCSGQSSWQ
jgi:leucyl-tRNA synthetase